MGGSWSVPGAAPELFVLGRQRLLRPDEQVFEAMLAGWRDQQLFGPFHPGRPRQRDRIRERESVMARRKLDFRWHLRRLMAAHEMWKTTDLVPLLRERGVELSASQVYRLVTDKPERLSMKVLIALCDILDCTPADLIDPYAEPADPPQNRG